MTTIPAYREYVEGSMTQIHLPSHPSEADVLTYVAKLLCCDEPVEITKFYDRDPKVIDWYYQAYSANNDCSPCNSIISIVKHSRSKAVYGDVLIMKNGPIDGSWQSAPDIDLQSLVRTIWWYLKSGREPASVFGERGLLRTVGQLDT
jgi:hypothetical protein